MAGIVEKYKSLVDRLYNRTLDKKIVWTSLADDTASCDVGSNLISLELYQSSDGEPFELLSITNAVGKIIESFTDGEMRGASPPELEFSTYYQKMQALRYLAIRQATGADQALDDILRDLDQD